MHTEMLETYRRLMTDLDSLPEVIDAAQQRLHDAKLQLGVTEREMAVLEPDLMLRVDGKNADERKANLLRLKASHSGWRKYEAQARTETQAVAMAAADVDLQTRRFSAVCYQAKLHAAMLQLLAAGGEPVQKVTTTIQAPADVDYYHKAKAVQGEVEKRNGSVTAADAAEIGL